jgi:hypothetical protein
MIERGEGFVARGRSGALKPEQHRPALSQLHSKDRTYTVDRWYVSCCCGFGTKPLPKVDAQAEADAHVLAVAGAQP